MPAVVTFAASGILSVAFVALLAMVRPPLAPPPEGGVKITVKLVLWPGAKVRGSARPFTVKPAPDKLAWVRARLVLPLLVKVSVIVFGVPAGTVPKLTLAGIEISAPDVIACAETGRLIVEASVVTTTLPLALPAASG